MYGEVSFAGHLKSPQSSSSPRSRHMVKSIVSRVSMKVSQKMSKEIIGSNIEEQEFSENSSKINSPAGINVLNTEVP
jgi:hypothetical protein